MLNLAQIAKFLPINAKKPAAKKSTIPDPDLLPYAGFYDPNTIITKNGELLKIIKIVGLGNDSAISSLVPLREAIRNAVSDYGNDGSFAFWFTTIRRRKNINPSGEFNDFFSSELNNLWIEQNNLDSHFVNELYISILIENPSAHRSQIKALSLSLLPNSIENFYRESLASSYQKLSELTSSIMLLADEYGAKLLGIVDFQGVYYSEALNFFGKLCNLHDERYPLLPCDISENLTTNHVFFGDREIEVIGDGFKSFAAIFSLKDYFELNLVALDKILQLPFEFIISQSFDFSSTKKDLADIEYQVYINKISGDEDFRDISEMEDFFSEESPENEKQKRFGKLQTTIMIISESQEELQEDIKKFCEKFQKLGMVFIREDIFLEHCFWSQLPGNFSFLRRQRNAIVSKIAGFSSLQSFPAGSLLGNQWGPAVCVLKTVINTPYFFNFHGDKGSICLILGRKNSGKTVLANFLLAQAQRFEARLFYIDFEQKARCFISALNGQYYDLSCDDIQDPSFLHLSPFRNFDSENSDQQQFLSVFIKKLLVFALPEASNEVISAFSGAIRRIIKNSSFQPSFSDILKELKDSQDQDLKIAAQAIQQLLSPVNQDQKTENNQNFDGKNSVRENFFGNNEEISLEDKIIGFDLSYCLQKPQLLSAILFYLIGKIEISLNQEPCILVIKEAKFLLLALGEEFEIFIEKLKSKNCVLLLVAQDEEEFAEISSTKYLVENLGVLMVMANPQPAFYHQEIFDLTSEEIAVLKEANPNLFHFLLKRDNDVVISNLDFSSINDLDRILSANFETLTIFHEIITQTKNETYGKVSPEVWVPIFFDLLEKLRDDRNEEKKEKARQENIAKRRLRRAGE